MERRSGQEGGKPDRRIGQRSFAIHGMRMVCDLYGQGDALLLLHGFGGAAVDWTRLKDGLARDRQLIIPDLRGHGRSTNPAGTYTHRQAALDVFALLDRLGVERIQAIGVSGGGNALLHMATQQPSRITAMVLVSAASSYGEAARNFMRATTVDGRSEQEWTIMRARHPRGDDQIRQLWSQANGFKDSYNDMNFTPPYLSTITAETLIIGGDRDTLVPPALALEMYRAIPRAYLSIVPNGGHGPISGAQRDSFLATADAFLRGAWRE